jgi:hypothetical protein
VWLTTFSIALIFIATGCVHKIHVTANSNAVAGRTIPGAAQVQVKFLALEGPDHMPGIAMLEWPPKDLQQALVDSLTQRQTFASVGTQPGDWLLSVKAWLIVRAPDRYVYRIHLEADLSRVSGLITRTYAANGEAVGPSVRWVTSSDQRPIQEATNQALDELAAKLEEDRQMLMD